MQRITEILKQYISERIPQTATNILFQMFNAVQAMFQNLEYRLDIYKRERNILTAQKLSSLRHLASQNGVEPSLRQSSKGLLQININPKLYNRCGYPLFIKPYTFFRNKISRMEYVYIGETAIRMNQSIYYIPVAEGVIKSKTIKGNGDKIQRIYFEEDYIADNSIIIESCGKKFEQVKSFYNNEGINENRQFVVKFSSDMQSPIVIYIKGLEYEQEALITYRLTNGEMGNIEGTLEFETDGIVDSLGMQVTPTDDEIKIINISGFTFGSNGSDENALRAAIGYNHDINLLFDNISYRNFLYKFSTILVQDVKILKENKQINHIYIWKKNSIIETGNYEDIQAQYKEIIDNKNYLLSEAETTELDEILNEHEYCLSSHVIHSPNINRYALQIMFDDYDTMNDYKDKLAAEIYKEFGKFLYIRNHYFNLELFFDKFKEDNKITFDYLIFNELIESQKIKFKKMYDTPYIIYHTVDGDKDYVLKSMLQNKNYLSNNEGPYLPILDGNFKISNSEYKGYQLYNDINFVVRN